MRDDTKKSFKETWGRISTIFSELLHRKVVIRQKFGGEVFAIPALIAILLAVFALKLVLIAVLILIIVGYRISFERR